MRRPSRLGRFLAALTIAAGVLFIPRQSFAQG